MFCCILFNDCLFVVCCVVFIMMYVCDFYIDELDFHYYVDFDYFIYMTCCVLCYVVLLFFIIITFILSCCSYLCLSLIFIFIISMSDLFSYYD